MVKTHVTKDRKTGSRTLVISLQGNETLDYVAAEWLRESDSGFLPGFRYETKGSGATFYYDVTGCAQLDKFVRARISTSQYNGIISSIVEINDLCMRSRIPADYILWSRKRIFLSMSTARPLYVIVPATGRKAKGATVRDLLTYLSDSKRIHFLDVSTGVSLNVIKDFVRRNPIFSSVEFRDILHANGMDSMHVVSQHDESIRNGKHINQEELFANHMTETTKKKESMGLIDPVAIVTGLTSDITLGEAVSHAIARTKPSMRHKDYARSDEEQHKKVNTLEETVTSSTQNLTGSSSILISSQITGDYSLMNPLDRGRDEKQSQNQLSDLRIQEEASGSSSNFVRITRVNDGFVFSVSGNRATIGRSASADIHLPGDSSMSRIHAILTYTGNGEYDLQDNDSSNGTYVGSVRVARGSHIRVSEGSSFRLSDTELMVGSPEMHG